MPKVKYGQKEGKKKISGSMWALQFFVSLRIIGSLIISIIFLASLDLFSGFTNIIFFLLYVFSLIGLIKKYNWAFLLIIGISLVDISSLAIAPEMAVAIFWDIILIILAFHVYRKSKEKIKKSRWIALFLTVGALAVVINFLYFYFPSEVIIDTSETLEPNEYFYVGIAPTYETTYSVFVNSTNYKTMDIYLLDEAELNNLMNGEYFEYYAEGSKLNVYHAQFQITLPPDSWYFVVLNLSDNETIEFKIKIY